jgi:putative addiction module component (TIGR02574 family)
MNSFSEVLNSALLLNEKERALIAEKIILTLDPKIDEQSDKHWQTEIKRRIKEIDEGKANLISWNQAKKRIG